MVETKWSPTGLANKKEFYAQAAEQLAALLDGERNWITNLANAASLLFNAFQDSELFGRGAGAVNWCGFYLDSSLFPGTYALRPDAQKPYKTLLLGPFQGRPGCISIPALAGRGVCADAFVSSPPCAVLVRDVHAYAGHIACDAQTNAEIVLPLVVRWESGVHVTLGVLDLDCLRVGGFEEEDREGLERIVRVVVEGCDWPI